MEMYLTAETVAFMTTNNYIVQGIIGCEAANMLYHLRIKQSKKSGRRTTPYSDLNELAGQYLQLIYTAACHHATMKKKELKENKLVVPYNCAAAIKYGNVIESVKAITAILDDLTDKEIIGYCEQVLRIMLNSKDMAKVTLSYCYYPISEDLLSYLKKSDELHIQLRDSMREILGAIRYPQIAYELLRKSKGETSVRSIKEKSRKK